MARALRDVTLRDGLQALPRILPTEIKVALYRRLLRAGVQAFQVASFVSPKRLPQMADAEAVWEALRPLGGVRDALILNLRGYERARALGVDRLEMVLSLSEAYERRNAGRGLEEAWGELGEVAKRAAQEGVHLEVGLAYAWGGEASEDEVLRAAERAVGLGAGALGLADTTGRARPEAVHCLVLRVREALPHLPLRVHLHEGGLGLENARAALEAGATALDATLGGLGGSPFAGEVGGNLAWERLAEAGLAPLDRQVLEEAWTWLEQDLGHG